MTDTKKKYLWIFGNAVQDITVEVDIERLSRELPDSRSLINLAEQGPQIKPGVLLKTQIGSQVFGVEVELVIMNDGVEEPIPEMYTLIGGEKYLLRGNITASHEDMPKTDLFLPCENLSWGGGGTNVVTFLRALVPSSEDVPVRYTDIAMDLTLTKVVKMVLRVLAPYIKTEFKPDDFDIPSIVRGLYALDPVTAELVTREVSAIATEYSPERSLDVYLASLSVEGVLYRPKVALIRRNWVFSRFRSAYREMNNKIILKGNFDPLPDEEEDKITMFLKKASAADVGAILINSLKDGPLFKAAYTLCKDALRVGNEANKDKNFVAILALTETTHGFIPWMKENLVENKFFPPFILVLNETEAHKLAMTLGGDEAPFMKKNDLPNIRLFARMVDTIRGHFNRSLGLPRIYVTLGDRGSLGVDEGGHVVYVSSFSKRGATIYDVNACGDAYCAAIALLEWAKRQEEYKNIAGPIKPKVDPRTQEIEYFMAVATAAAYCKATNRRGRVYAAELKDLLQYIHLPSSILWTVQRLMTLTTEDLPPGVDENFRLKEPEVAHQFEVTEALGRLIK